jgi:type IV secretory pathway VirB2 component (pilin)
VEIQQVYKGYSDKRLRVILIGGITLVPVCLALAYVGRGDWLDKLFRILLFGILFVAPAIYNAVKAAQELRYRRTQHQAPRCSDY